MNICVQSRWPPASPPDHPMKRLRLRWYKSSIVFTAWLLHINFYDHPLTAAFVDLSANLTQLCRAMTSFELAERDIELHLAITQPVLLDAKRCWQAELITSELITNALRHAFAFGGGRISVAVKAASGQVICCVSDDGSPTATLKRGFGSELIDALAADLDGHVERIHNASGTTATLFFPEDPDERSIVAIPAVKYGGAD